MRLLVAAVLLAVLAGCAHPVYVCQPVAPGTLACLDSRDFEKALNAK